MFVFRAAGSAVFRALLSGSHFVICNVLYNCCSWANKERRWANQFFNNGTEWCTEYMHNDAYIGGRLKNNIKCVVHDDLGWKNRTTRYILPCHWLYEWFSQLHRRGTDSVLSRSPSVVFIITLEFSRQKYVINHTFHLQSTQILWICRSV